jgi:hypothetical protein
MDEGAKQRAVVVAATTFGLQGVDGDADRVAAMLERRGFSIDLCRGRTATRDGILAACQKLIEDSAAGDAAVLYYAGHGGRAMNSDPRVGDPRYPDVPRAAQFIVPTDYDGGADDDFRGITAWELSVSLAALTARTLNVTAIFDCCHAAEMTRLAEDRPRGRSLGQAPRVDISARLAAVRARAGAAAVLDPMANPTAVRLFACGEHETAWEYRRADGEPGGVFTESLLAVLAACDHDTTWDAIGHAVRERVRCLFPAQRPVLGGPVGRAPFSLAEPSAAPWAPLIGRDGVARIPLGRLGTLGGGARLIVMPPGATVPDAGRQLARAKVVRTHALVSELALDPALDHVPLGALAFLDPSSARPSIARVLADGAALADGIPLEAVDVTWGGVVDGRCLPLPSRGAAVSREDRLYVRIASRWQESLFVHVLLAGAGRLECLTRVRTTTGLLVEPGQTLTLGAVDGDGPIGLRLPGWDEAAGPERSLLVIAATEPIDLGLLAPGTPAELQPAHVATAAVRDVRLHDRGPGRDGGASGFAAVPLLFTLDRAAPLSRSDCDAAAPCDPNEVAAAPTAPALRVPPAAAIASPVDRGHGDRLALLYLTADPGRTRDIAVARECRSIEREIALGGGRRLGFHPRLAATIGDLSRFLRELSPAVLHFSGHARARDGLAFEDELGGWFWVPPEHLAAALAALRLDLGVLLLNACHADRLVPMLRGAARCVIGMRGVVTDAAACSFSIGFYRALGNGDSVAHAIEQATAEAALGGRAFGGVEYALAEGVVLEDLRLHRRGAAVPPPMVRASMPSDADAASLARLVDLDGLLTAGERRAITAVEEPSGPRRTLVRCLRQLAVLLGRTRTRAALAQTSGHVDAMLASVTARIELHRGVLCPVIVADEPEVGEACRRAVAFDLDAWIETHRALLAQGGIPIMRAPVAVEIDPMAAVPGAVRTALAEHAEAMQELTFQLRLEHLGDEDRVDPDELLPIPGTLVLDRLVVPVPTRRSAVVRVSRGGEVLLELRGAGGAPVAVPTAGLPAGCRLDWSVVTRDVFQREERCAAGFFRVATTEERAALAGAGSVEAQFRLGAWDDVVRRLWPAADGADLSEPQWQLLVQLVRYEHEWLMHGAPRWDRLDRCGRALSWLESVRGHTNEGGGAQ